MASAQVCPVVGTTNTVLPPDHPAFDINKPGQVCPITNATTDHHESLQKHPAIPSPNATTTTTTGKKVADASACPALKSIVKEDPMAKKTDESVCPVVGTATTILPPDHPDMKNAKEGDECPKTKATVGHHLGKVHVHPPVQGASGVCPVVGAKA